MIEIIRFVTLAPKRLLVVVHRKLSRNRCRATVLYPYEWRGRERCRRSNAVFESV